MAHPVVHARSAVKKWGGKEEDYLPIEEWFDETKSWVSSTMHRMFRHHSQGIFECEKVFGKYIINSDGKIVFVRYIGERHVMEDCNGYIPTAQEWVNGIANPPLWMRKTMNIEKGD